MPPKNPEDRLQIAVATYLDLLSRTKKFRWFHPANERKTKLIQKKNGKFWTPEGTKLKAMGVKPGVPDVMIFKPKWKLIGNDQVRISGLAIELKAVYANKKKNYPTPQQKEWMQYLEQVGWEVHVAYDFDTVKKIVDEYVGV